MKASEITSHLQELNVNSSNHRGKSLSLPRDAKGHPVEPGLEPSPFGPDDLIGLGVGTIAKKLAGSELGKIVQQAARQAPEIGSEIGKKLQRNVPLKNYEIRLLKDIINKQTDRTARAVAAQELSNIINNRSSDK